MIMSRVVLQVPISIDLRKKAEAEAKRQGYSSLQEVVRLFLTKLAQNKVDITIQIKK